MGTISTTVTALARELGISRAALYYRPKKPSDDEQVKTKIMAVMINDQAYGSRRVAIALTINRKKAQRIMRAFGLKPKLRRGWRPMKPDDQNRPETQVINILQQICPLFQNIIWAGDFTYLWYQERFWYVATAIDVYTREIVGWHIANHHTSDLIVRAFDDAVWRQRTTPIYFHSDQGSEYVSGAYAATLAKHHVVPSHSRKSSPWQNGFQESFYNNFKLELGDIRRFAGVGELIATIHSQINYYNQRRIHTALKMPPTVFKETRPQKKTAMAAAYVNSPLFTVAETRMTV